jgi:hypothetical protein
MRNSYKFWSVNLKRKDHLEDTGADERRILKLIGAGSLDWIHLAQYRDEWQVLVTNLSPLKDSEFLD